MYMGQHFSSFPFDEKTFEQFFKDGEEQFLSFSLPFRHRSNFLFKRPFLLNVYKNIQQIKYFTILMFYGTCHTWHYFSIPAINDNIMQNLSHSAIFCNFHMWQYFIIDVFFSSIEGLAGIGKVQIWIIPMKYSNVHRKYSKNIIQKVRHFIWK